MLFRVRQHVPYGSRVCLTGSTQALGCWQVHRAISCQWTDGDMWETRVDPLANDSNLSPPTRLEFKFFVVSHPHSEQWEPGLNHALVIPAGVDPSTDAIVAVTWASAIEITLPQTPSSKQPSVTSDSSHSQSTIQNGNGNSSVHATFRLTVKLAEGERPYIVGSPTFLGSWNKMHAPRLEQVKEGVYEIAIDIDTHAIDSCFEYKYFVRTKDDCRRWETVLNRIANPSQFDSAIQSDALLWDDHWDKTRLEFSIYFPPAGDSQRMYITGDPPELGAWHKPGPTPMLLGPEQRLETDVVGRKWYLKVWVPVTQRSFQYRYVVIDDQSHAELWEREPNRQADLDSVSTDRDPSDKDSQVAKNSVEKGGQPVQVHAVNSVTVFKDVNFVSAMRFDAVPDDMFIGPYPQTVEDVDILAEAGVTAVLNVQTDEDFEHRGVQWDKLMKRYGEKNILVKRFQIRDFDRDSLRSKLNGGAHALDDLLKQGRKAYVHCTAGMGRAPAVVVAYLCWVQGMSLDAAVRHVKKHRTVAVPNVPVLEQVLSKQPY